MMDSVNFVPMVLILTKMWDNVYKAASLNFILIIISSCVSLVQMGAVTVTLIPLRGLFNASNV
jgi:hypothetical protein